MSMADNIRDLVERARAGDQNAMGMIAAVRESANAGSVKAKKSHKDILEYCKTHPVTGDRIGVDAKETLQSIKSLASPGTNHEKLTANLVKLPLVGGKRAYNCAVVILANGLPIDDDLILALAEQLNDNRCRDLFLESAVNQPPSGLPPEALPFLYAGLCVGQARSLQVARSGSDQIGFATSNFGVEYAC